MKKILIQYLYLFAIAVIIWLTILGCEKLFACEDEQIIDETLPVCEEMEVDRMSYVESLCKKQENINTIIKALEKLGESGTLPK
jgi:RsiW-degrading membrane proteinase PrsW (M82 family)